MSTFGQAGSLAGSLIGNYIAPGYGGVIGSFIGAQIGGAFDPTIHNLGPRLADLKVQDGSYGTPITVSFGTSRVAGTVIYVSTIRETKTETNAGKGGQKAVNDTFTYAMDVAVVLTNFHGFSVKGITGVRRTWANGALVISNSEDATIGTLIAGTQFADQITVYPGDYDQLPDPTLEAALGVGNVSAYRGFSYVVVRGLVVSSQGSPVPQLEFEVVQGGTLGVAKQIFAGYKPASPFDADEGLGWCGKDSAMTVNKIGTGSVLQTNYWHAGDEVPQVNNYIADYQFSGALRTFANCATAPIMIDLNFLTSDPLDGMALRIWDMRLPPDTSIGETETVASNTLLITTPVSVVSYPFYTLTVNNRAAFEELTGAYAFGNTGGTSFFYGINLQFAPDGGDAHIPCILPSDRCMIDMAIFQGILYVWNFTQTAKLDGTHDTWITAYDDAGTIVFDEAHFVDELLSIGEDKWGRLCVNEFGTFTWMDRSTGGTRVGRFTPDGPQTLCVDSNVGDGDTPGAGSTKFMGFWTDGRYANIGPSDVVNYGEIAHFWTIQFQALAKATVTLASALKTIALIAGLVDAEIDVSAQTQTLRGYAYKQIGPATSFIEPLCSTFQVEGRESGGQLQFTNIGGPTVADIPFDDLGFGQTEGQSVDVFPLTRIQDTDLPRSVSVVYANWDADFQIGSEAPSRRLITDSVNDVVIETPVTATADESIKRQDVLLYRSWRERDTRTTSLSRAWSHLDTSDPVNAEYPRGVWTRQRVTRIEYMGAFLNISFVRDEPSDLISSAVASNVASAQSQTQVTLLANTNVTLLDVPLLRNADDGFGFYVAFASNGATWNGGEFYKTAASVTSLANSTQRTAVGSTVTALPDFVLTNVFDRTSVLRVYVGNQSLSSQTETAVLASSSLNAAMVAQECIQFCTATPVSGSPGTYDLSILLRYRLGTEWSNAHRIGDPFVLLQAAGIRRVHDTAADRGVSYVFKGVTIGQNINDASPLNFANRERGLMPLPPTNLAVRYGSPINLSWRRRSRLSTGQSFLSSGNVLPLGEVSEAYEIEFATDDAFASVVSTLQSTTQNVDYTAEMLSEDFPTGVDATMFWRVFQISEQVGRGFPSSTGSVHLVGAPLPTPVPVPTVPTATRGVPILHDYDGTLFIGFNPTADATQLGVYTSTNGTDYTFTALFDPANPSNANPAPGASVVLGGSVYVATLGIWTYTSTDLVHWAGVMSTVGWSAGKPVWDGSQFVRLGQGPGFATYVYTSSNGITWTQGVQIASAVIPFDIYRLNGNYYVIGAGATPSVFRSTNLTTWTELADTVLPANGVGLPLYAWTLLIFSAGVYLAFGSQPNTSWANKPLIKKSTNGTSWTDVSPTLVSVNDLHAVAYFNSKFFAYGLTKGAITSPDGGTWTEHLFAGGQYLTGDMLVSSGLLTSAFGNGPFNEANAVAGLLTTTDLTTWNVIGGGSITLS